MSIDLASGEVGIAGEKVEGAPTATVVGRMEAKALVSALSRSLSVEESALSSSSERKAAMLRPVPSAFPPPVG